MSQQAVLFGGTFDPVHHGHLIAARCIAEQRGLTRVTLVPSARSPHKGAAIARATDRLAMLRLAVRDDPRFEVSDVEARRDGPSYTFDTLQEYRRRLGPEARIFLIIGADMLADLPNWRCAAELVALAEVITALRPPWHLKMDEILGDLRRRLTPEAADRLARGIVGTPLIDISATEIRRRIADGKPIRYLVPDAVAEYIHAHGLYAAGTRPQGEGPAPAV